MLAAVSRDIREVIGTLWGFSSLDAADAEQRRRAAPEDRRRGAGARRTRPRPSRCATTSAGRRRSTCTGSASRPSSAFPTATARGVAVVGLVIGIDTGGTFTDMVVFDPRAGRIDSLKTSSTPEHARPGDRQRARRGRHRRRPRSRRSPTARRSGTNALIERTGCKVAFVTTSGLRGHAVHPADQPQGALRPRAGRKPEPLVASRRLCLGRRRAARRRRRRGAAGRRGRGAGALPHDPRVGRRGGRALPALLLRQHRPRGAGQGDPRRGAARRAGLGLLRGRADLARVRALVDDDRRRVPAAALRPLRREPRRRRCATRA